MNKLKTIWILIIFSMLSPCRMMGQKNSTISGKVINAETQEAVQFVNISIKGKPSGTTTGLSGEYTLSLPDKENQIIVFSHINYKKKEVPVAELKNMPGDIISLIPKQEMLENVIVSASLYDQSKNTLTKSSTIIGQKLIKDDFHSNVIDVLASNPGFTQIWEYHSPILLRGLNSKRIVILKNGNRRIGTFPGGYFAQNMNIYDIKKIEIIKGPGSVIYGNGAISGIINVISNEPFGENETKATIISGYGSNNNEFLEAASVCHKRQNFGLVINGKYRKTDDYVYGNGETADNSNVEDRDISLSSGVRLSSKQTIKINVDYHYGNWGKPRGFNGTTKRFTKIRNEEDNLHADIGYTYKSKGFLEQFSVNIYADDGMRDYYKYKYSEVSGKLSSLELVHYKDRYGGGRMFSVFSLSEKSKLTLGADGYAFRLDNPADIIDYYNETEGVLAGYMGAGQQNIGAFVRNETEVGNKLKIISGIRYDYAEVLEGENDTASGRYETRTAFSGNVGMVLSLSTNNHISLNIGQAFRMPTAEELFTETISCKGTKKGNPDLEPEYSRNIDLGFRGNSPNNKLNYDISLFVNILNDYICEIQDTVDEDVDFTFKNTDAIIMGGELSASYRFDNVLKTGNVLFAGLGSSYLYGVDKFVGDDAPLFGIPPLKLKLDLNYRGQMNKFWLTGYSFKLQTEYAAAQNRVPEVEDITDAGPWGYVASDPHTIFNFSVGLNSNSLPGRPKLRFIVKNIFDTDYQPFGSYIPAMGRNFKTTLSFSLN